MEPLSPVWWASRLYDQIVNRLEWLELYDDYYSGNHHLPWLPDDLREEFRTIQRMARCNYMGLVVDAKAERIQVEGFRAETPEISAELWRIWQANHMDADSDQLWLEALIGGLSYVLVAPNAEDPATPIVTTEHASQAVVEYVPGSARRVPAAGLKVWQDDWTDSTFATLYLPNAIYKFRTGKSISGAPVRWELRDERVDGERNPLGVSLVEIPNNPRMLAGGVSELHDVIDIQDRINKTLIDRLVTQDYGAFPQKFATGLPDVDENGEETPSIKLGQTRLVSTDVVGAAFGQWTAAALDPYSNAKREDVKDIASRTRTPAQYLLGELNNVNGETLQAAEAGLVSTILQRQRPFGEGVERVQRLVQKASGQSVSGALETIWRDPQYRTPAQAADAAMKLYQSKIVPLRQTLEDLGYSAVQIDRMERQRRDDAATAGLGDLSSLFAPKPDEG